MPDQEESTRPEFEKNPMPMVALPPTYPLPEAWEGSAVFRETFLLYWTDIRHNGALRAFGKAFYEVTLEAVGKALLPYAPDPFVRYELAAVLADLRHLEGFLWMVSEHSYDRRTEPEKARLIRVARRIGRRIGRLAGELEIALRFDS